MSNLITLYLLTAEIQNCYFEAKEMKLNLIFKSESYKNTFKINKSIGNAIN